MKDKGKSSQKKNTVPPGAPKARRADSGGGARTPIDARFQAIFESSRDAIGVSKAGIHIFVNPAYLELFGFSPGTDLAGKPVLELIAPESRDQVKAHILCRERGESAPSTYETRGLRTNGSEFTMEVNVSSYQENGEDHTLVILRDITELNQTETALRISEEKFRKVFITSPDSININRLEDGMYISINHGFTETTGYTAADVIGKTSQELNLWVDPADRQKLVEGLRKQGEVKNLEARFRLKDGRIIDGLMSASIVEIGHIPHIVSVTRDITERKQAESALKRSETRYRLLYNETPVLLHSIDRNGILVEINDYWLKTLGYERSEVIGRKVTDFFTEASRKHAQEVVQPAFFRDGIVKEVSYQFVKKSGDVMEVLLSATAERDAAGEVVRSLAVIVDVTERKRAEAALRASEERFKAITMTASDAILLMDDRGKLVHWNPAAERMFGYSAEEALGKDLHLFLAPLRLHENYLEGFEKFVRTGQGPVINKSVELSAHRKDGTEFPIEVSTSAMNINGRWHALGIVRDINERKLLEQERLKSQKLESIGTLAGGIAHDFNNLLQGIFGYISMAKLTIDQREKSLAMLEQAEKALHLSVNLTSQLLTFAKGGKPVKKVVSLRAVIEDAVKFALSGSRNVASISIADELRSVEIDEGQIGQVVQNIVLNADQSMPLGGGITITARNAPVSEAAVLAAATTGDIVEITIQDQGTGIPLEHLSRIFDPYFTTKEKGSGLGLATSYSIIKNHGGLITVASELGKGTTFTISLPASGAPVEQEEAPAPLAAGNKGRILVMDDEQVVRDVIGELLRSLGHEVEFAERGETAVMQYTAAMNEGSSFDIVILDLTVRGGMGGAEAVKKLLELDPNVKAVVSSGYSGDAVIADYRKYGFTAYLKKPFDIEKLHRVLNDILD